METVDPKDRIVAAFGDAPQTNAKYRLPISVTLLVLLLLLGLFNPERGLYDLAYVLGAAYFMLDSLGDRVWTRSVRAAAWLRLAGRVAFATTFGAFALSYYEERQWIFLIPSLVVCAALVCWLIYNLFIHNRDSPQGSHSR